MSGYIWGKQTWLYTAGGCCTTMEGLGWPCGRGGVGVLAGLGWKGSETRAEYASHVWGRLMPLIPLKRPCPPLTDLGVEPRLELVGVGVQSGLLHLPALGKKKKM